MKIVHVVPDISDEASGPSYLLPRLCACLAARGNEVELSCLAARGAIPGVRLDVHTRWPVVRRFAISPSHASALYEKAKRVDVVHNHSLWSMTNVAAGWVVPGRRARLVTSPHGTLAPWALNRKRLLKRALWPLQNRVLVRADLVHATSESEYGAIRTIGLSAPVAIIPNGVDLPPPLSRNRRTTLRTLLFLGRIHPVKGIDRLLGAWRQLQDRHTDWQLVIAGAGESEHVRGVREVAAQLDLERVEFPGALYGDDKSHAYWNADLFVLPTYTENFGMVVAEALAHACPAVVSRGAPWSGLTTQGCGWWVSNDVDSLAEALDSAMCVPQEVLEGMGMKGRNWMEREYSWAMVAEKMETAYRWICGGGAPPSFVRED